MLPRNECNFFDHRGPWRRSLIETLQELHDSLVRRRPLSLSNLCRLFEIRLRQIPDCDPLLLDRGLDLGRKFLHDYYRRHQPFEAAPSLDTGEPADGP